MTFVVSALFLASSAVADVRDRQAGRRFAEELRTGWREFVSRTWLWVMGVHWALFLMLAFAPFTVLGPLIARRSLGGAAAWGLIETMFGAGAVAGRLVALRVRPARPVLACASVTFLTAPSFLALAHVGSVGAVCATRFLAGAAVAFYGIVWSTTLQRQIPPDKLARVSS